ncbi:protein IMPAIRED IN BABA-INDUCED STERILITY 1-like [Musa acuminata AAA Group]|uniref:protein IMPAIRED IN BABA-INDUCED STERILITY 1-like n=1 Tax=Musa acuminata AAA Group TaxID=214697 RepID=UPI0031D8A891
MGCVSSKNAVSVTPAVDSSGFLRDHRERSGPILACSLRHQTGQGAERGYPERKVELDSLESKEYEKLNSDSTRLQSFRLGNLHKHIEGEQVAAGWPSWLSVVAGEAIHGWVPLKADSFEKLEKIGQGTYSSVFRARDLDTGKIVALKKVRFDNFEPESVRFMAREIKILRRLDHPNIVKLEGLITSQLSCSLYLVFEYMEHDLSGLSSSPDIKFSESQIKCYMQQMLSGLEHCHLRGIIHRDIKGANILVNNEGVLKIADFGLANFFSHGHKQRLTGRVVTLWYRPPELLLGSTDYEETVDLWSVGCVFAEMFIGRPILQGRTEVEQLHKIFKLCGSPPDEYWNKSTLAHATIFRPHHPYENILQETFKSLPGSAISLLETFLSIEPYKRGTATSSLEAEYFRTKPYACEPSSLSKYPPTKEIDAKSRDETRRIRGASRSRGSEATRRPLRANRASRAAGGLSRITDSKEESQINAVTSSGNVKKDCLRVDGETGLFVDLQPLPLIKHPNEGHSVCNSQEDFALSGPLCVSASSGFAWAKMQGEGHASGRSGSRCSSKSHLSYERDPSCIENVKSKHEFKGQENGDVHVVSKSHVPHELAKRAMLKRWTQLEHPDSLDPSDVYYSQEFSGALYKGDPLSMRHNNLGFHDQDRIEFSGPLLSESHKVDELLQKHERHMRQAIRRSWFQRGRKQGK